MKRAQLRLFQGQLNNLESMFWKVDVSIQDFFMVSWSNWIVFHKGHVIIQDLFKDSWSNMKVFYKEYFYSGLFLWSVDQIKKYFKSKCAL